MEEKYIVFYPDGRSFGPMTLALLADWQREGSVPAQATLQRDPPAGSPVVPVREVLPFSPGVPQPADSSDVVGTIVPYKNGQALIGYYCAVGSLIPCLGLFLGPAALILGVLGLKRVDREPAVKGRVHAWIAIILGGLCGLANIALIVLIVAGIMSGDITFS